MRFYFSNFTILVAQLLLGSLTSATALAETPNALPDQRCAMHPADLYERPARMTSVSLLYADRCLNTDRRRVPQIFNLETQYGLTPISNIRHRDSYWIAYIPFDDQQIESINFSLLRTKDLFVTTGHGQLEIVFKNPITLRSQTDFNKMEQVTKLYYSVEAVVPVGVKEAGKMNATVSILSAKRGVYPLVGRMASEQQRQVEDQELFWQYGRYPMKLQAGEKVQLLKLAINEADQFGFSRTFQMLDSNCVGTLIGLLDELPRIKAMNLPGYHHENSIDPGIGPAKRAVEARGLIEDTPKVIKDAQIN